MDQDFDNVEKGFESRMTYNKNNSLYSQIISHKSIAYIFLICILTFLGIEFTTMKEVADSILLLKNNQYHLSGQGNMKIDEGLHHGMLTLIENKTV